jgi:hypothetical protein
MVTRDDLKQFTFVLRRLRQLRDYDPHKWQPDWLPLTDQTAVIAELCGAAAQYIEELEAELGDVNYEIRASVPSVLMMPQDACGSEF